MSEALHVWELNDGEERWWIVAESAEDAIRFGREDYSIGEAWPDSEPVECSMWPDDKPMTVGDPDAEPGEPSEETRTGAEWAQCRPGYLVGTTCLG